MKGVDTTVVSAGREATCQVCHRHWTGPNALAVAARHAAAHRHLVVARATSEHVYRPGSAT